MNTLKHTFLTIALGLTAMTAAAHDSTEPHTVTVNFAALNTSSTAGAQELYQRLRAAARQVCASADGAPLSAKRQYRSCVDTALANAVMSVNLPLVTSAYHASTKDRTIRVASR